MEDKRALYCAKCDVALRPMRTTFTYLGYEFQAELPRCPICGRSFVSETLARGRVREIESMLETK